MQFSNSKLAELRGATASDDELVLIQKYIISSFPVKQRDLPTEIRQYFPYCDELSVKNGLNMKGKATLPAYNRLASDSKLHEYRASSH